MTQADDMDLGAEVSKSFIAKVLMAVVGFVGTIITARVLGPTDFGGFYLLLAVVSLSSRPIGGIATACKKRISESQTNAGEIFGGGILLVLIGFSIAIVCGFFLQARLNSYIGIEYAYELFVILFTTLSIWMLPINLLNGTGKVGRASWFDLGRSFLTTPAQVGLVLLGFGITGMVLGLALATVILAVIVTISLGVRPQNPSEKTLSRIWEYAKFSSPGKLVSNAYTRLDVILLGLLSTTALVGQYEVALKLTLPAVILSKSIAGGILPRVSNLDSRDKPVRATVTDSLGVSGILAIPIFFGSLIVAEPLVVQVYGPEYADAALFVVFLSLYRVIGTQARVLESVVNGLDKPKYTLYSSTATILLNIVLGVGLLFAVGPIGVAIATVVSEMFRYGVLWSLLRTIGVDSPIVPSLLRFQIEAGSVMVGILLIGTKSVQLTSLIGLTVTLVGGAGVYFGWLIFRSQKIRHFTRHSLRTITGLVAI